jgi:hypothetical protein
MQVWELGHTQTGPRGLLVAYTKCSGAHELDRLDEERRMATAVEAVGQVHPELRRHLEGARLPDARSSMLSVASMSDVFLSYAREDQSQAEALAAVFARQGWSVWWDREILAGRAFEDDIERELRQAAVVVVLWSRASVASSWVRNEAAEGMARRILVPARIDDVAIPLGFRGLQTADLASWDGGDDGSVLQPLKRAVAARLAAGREHDPSATGGAAGVVSGPPPRSDLGWRRMRPLEGVLLRMAVSFAAGLTYPSVPLQGGLVIATAMVGVSALAVWARRHRPPLRALAGLELELLVLALLFAAGITLDRGASPWVEWPELVKHFWRVLLRAWVSLALLAAVAQWVTSRFFGRSG